MIDSNTNASINHSLFRGTSSIIIFGFLGWILLKTAPIFNHVKLSVTGDYTSLTENTIVNLSNPMVEMRNLNSIWTFRIDNKEKMEIPNATLELPFSGYYKIMKKNGQWAFSEFENKIKIGALSPLNEASIVIWSTNKPNPEGQPRARLVHNSGAVDVDFPVKVEGFWAWLIRSKHFISLFLLALTLRYLF